MKNVRLCHALCIRRGLLSSHTVACTTFAHVCTRAKKYEFSIILAQENVLKRDCSSQHNLCCHSPCCASCHFRNCRQSVEDEEDACDQLTFLLCRSRSGRNFSLNMTVSLSESFNDIGNDSSLFTLKSCKFVSCLRTIGPSSHGIWLRAVVDAQYKAVFVSGSLFPGCHLGDVDCCVMFKTPTILSCPAMKSLDGTIFVVVFPSAFNGVVLVSCRASFRVPRFPVVVLPLALAIFCASAVIKHHEVDINSN